MPDLGAAPRLPPEGLRDWLSRQVATAVDTAALLAGQRLVDAFVLSEAGALPALRSSADELLDPALLEAPERFFNFGDGEPSPVGVAQRQHRRAARYERTSWELSIRYRPFAVSEPDGEAGPILLERWAPTREQPIATVVALHGFGMGSPRAGAFALFAREWLDRGLDVVLVTLPGHGARKPADARVSGERFAIPDVQRLGEAVRQAVYEIRLVHQWLLQRTHAPVGLLGLSLGGYLAALSAGLYDDFDFVIPVIAPVCMGDLAYRFLSESRAARDTETGFSLDEMRASFWLHSPLAHPLRTPRERVLIVSGRGDQIVPAAHSQALWTHWGEPTIHWFAGGHVAPFGRSAVVGAITRHLQRIDIL
jgi:alpha-beta hydrolase superfamily lysophospholipase